MSNGAKKNDSDKLRYDLIPPVPLEALAAVYTLGAKKYGDNNWRKGMAWGRIYAALLRHLQAWWQGETHAADDGQHHLASVLWCAATLMEYERTNVGTDDRDESTPMLKGCLGCLHLPACELREAYGLSGRGTCNVEQKKFREY